MIPPTADFRFASTFRVRSSGGGWFPTSVGVKYGGGPLCGHYFYEVFCVMGCVNRQGYNPLRVQGAK